MNYENCRLLLFSDPGPLALAIRWQTRSKYSHAAVLMPDGKTVVESYPGVGVRVRRLTVNDWAKITAFRVDGFTAAHWEEVIRFATAQIGAGYDWVGVIRFLTRKPATVNGRYFCSELAFEAISRAGKQLLRAEPCDVSPAMLALSPFILPDPPQ